MAAGAAGAVLDGAQNFAALQARLADAPVVEVDNAINRGAATPMTDAVAPKAEKANIPPPDLGQVASLVTPGPGAG